MTDLYRLGADRAPGAQLAFDLAVVLDPPAPLSSLSIGARFLLEASGREGRLVARGSGSVTVAVLEESGRWSRVTWSPETVVRRMRA